MNAADALRWLAFEARRCKDRDSHEALCLTVPWVTEAFYLQPMDEVEALAFKHRLKEVMHEKERRAA